MDISIVRTKINRIYEEIPILKKLGLEFNLEELKENEIIISFDGKDYFYRKGGFLFGGFVELLFDAFLGLLVRIFNDKANQVTVNLNIDFLEEAKGNKFYINGRIIRKGSSIVFVEGNLYNGEKIFAKANGIWKIF
ncbi:PaaI family thioesterase [Nanobdella aerobiophila]|nr:PaaI family thioesterase [Nanobdella aerobiophila]